MKHRAFRTYSIVLVFLSLVSFPLLNDRFRVIDDIKSFENRRLSPEPAFDLEHLDPFPVAYENYYKDTFALRSRLITWFNIYNCVLLKKSPVPDKMMIGKNNWLFLVGEDIDIYTGKGRFTDKELRTIKDIFEENKKYLSSKNCKFYVVITPGKANVYPENLPFHVYQANPQGRGEQLNSYLQKNSSIDVIDLFSQFKKLKQDYPLYYSIDNHWNHLGAFLASNIIIENMAEKIPRLKPLSINDFKITQEIRTIGNMKHMLGDLSIYEDTEYQLTPIKALKATDAQKKNYPPTHGFPYPAEYEDEMEIANSDLPRLLIFSDSFGSYAFPFLSENFSRTVKIFGGWDYIVEKPIVESEKPDVVLLMIQEPVLRSLLDNPR